MKEQVVALTVAGVEAEAEIGRLTAIITAFLARIHARPAYLRALERGGPYALMK